MVSIRSAVIDDIFGIQNVNISCLAENYKISCYRDHLYIWPRFSYVAEINKKIVGYVLISIEEGDKSCEHITSIAIMRSYRRLGIATNLIIQAQKVMKDFDMKHISLHVRETNIAAFNLYKSLGFQIIDTITGYYQDGENAYKMKMEIK